MGRFAALLPELMLSIGGTILMVVAAFAGRRGSGVVSWLCVLLLLAATVALIGAPSHAGPVFDGLVTEDLFASFGRAIMYP
ncbi:MAG TPA: NADH-quinone oxidoreductase subunit N, partial [Sphingomicrobium sp.]